MSEKSLHCTLTDHELAAKADQWIDELIASGGKSFTMQVPARPNADTDLIFAELNNRFKKLITERTKGPMWVKAQFGDYDTYPVANKDVFIKYDEYGAQKEVGDLQKIIELMEDGCLNVEWYDESETATESPTEQPGREVDDWISVDEKLPQSDDNNSVYCIVYDVYWGVVVRPYNQAHNCWDGEDGDDYYTDAKGGKVTHWKPLPESPFKKLNP